MKIEHSDKYGLAMEAALSSFDSRSRFPNQVFTNGWDSYLFFDPSQIFDNDFPRLVDILLGFDESSVMALVNIGNLSSQVCANPEAIYLERGSTPRAYVAKLIGDGGPNNWMFMMDRYICASERGNWIIYCEKENDIGVMAFNKQIKKEQVLLIRDMLRARFIGEDTKSQGSRFFDFSKLVSSWREDLDIHYGK